MALPNCTHSSVILVSAAKYEGAQLQSRATETRLDQRGAGQPAGCQAGSWLGATTSI